MDDGIADLNRPLEGRYRIEREIGRGGMAVVYLAQDVRHDRQVALKVLDRDVTSAVGAERFLREIRIAARLQHPHILPLFDSGEAGGHLFFVMPYVEGETLRMRIDRETQLDVLESVRIVREIAGALAHAHGEGVIHRDLKPENVLLSGGHAVLADFGVARAMMEGSAVRLTQSGLAMGSPLYMAPEQLDEGREVDGRVDLYSLGCVAYEMLVGVPPFTGPTTRVVLARHANDPVPPIRTARPGVPTELEGAVLRCLAKVPADRFASAGELVVALEGGGKAELGVGASAAAHTPAARPPVSAPPPDAVPAPTSMTASGEVASGSPAAERPAESASFLTELKRRNVYKAAVLYGAVAFGAVQFAELAFPTFGLEWAYDYVVMAALLGFPLVLVFAWAYDLTHSGLRRATPMGVPTRTAELSVTGAQRRRLRRWAVGAAGLAVFAGLFPFAYGGPARVQVDVSEADARGVAQAFLRERGAVGAFEETVVFHPNGSLVAYLQRHLGVEEAQRMAAQDLHTWDWHFRWFQPEQTQEFRVAVGAGGQVGSFQRTEEESAGGGHPTEAEARAAAEAFLAEHGLDPAALEPIEASSTRRQSRTDHHFAWLAPDRIGLVAEGERGAVNRVVVDLHGTEIAAYRNVLNLPEAHQREQRRADSIRDGFMTVLFVGSTLGLLVLLVRGLRAGVVSVRWPPVLRLAAAVGVATAIFFGLDWPQFLFDGYSTETLLALMIGGHVLLTALVGVFMAAAALVLAAALDGFGRAVYPGRMEGWDALLEGRFRDANLGEELANGIGLGFLFLGFHALTLTVQSRVPGSWNVVEWSGLGSADTLQPALAVVFGEAAMGASMGALLLCAVVAVLRRHTHATAIAVVVPAVALSLATSDAQPVYVAAAAGTIEVVILAVGFVRYGPLAVFAAIFVAGTVPVGLAWVVWPDMGLTVSGVLVLVLSLLPAIPALLVEQEEAGVPAPALAG